MKSYTDLLAEARQQVREVTPAEVGLLLGGSDPPILVDVREDHEWALGYIPGARLVAKSFLEQKIESEAPDRSRPIVLYCAGGIRSLFAGQTLRAMGYRQVASMAGGLLQWKALGLSWTQPPTLTPDQRERYSRHRLIPEVGLAGQARLLDSKVLLIGAGGLGSPAALYLAAAGVGTIGIVDFDEVDLSNLQRQILHHVRDIGRPKVDSARDTIGAINPDVTVVPHPVALTSENAMEIISQYDDSC